ncbi:MAG: hypothetical protein LBE97_00690 [Holosporales bacterium]|jgi:F0F1-type ATP synthase epsilon subunit|nr:hypothetical protein [Holosporales bacterium]
MFDLVLISNEEKIYEGKIEEVNVLTDIGPISILPQHQPYITKIKDNICIKKPKSTIENIAITTGFLYTNGARCFIVIEK